MDGALGGSGGEVSGGQINARGQYGGVGRRVRTSEVTASGNAFVGISGGGGSSDFGSGAIPRRVSSTGSNSTVGGDGAGNASGGSGAVTTRGAASQPGGAGGDGICLVWEFS